MNLTKTLYAIALLLGLSLNVNSQSKDFIDIEKLETYLNAIHSKKGFNGEILVAKGKNIRFQQTLGLASY